MVGEYLKILKQISEHRTELVFEEYYDRVWHSRGYSRRRSPASKRSHPSLDNYEPCRKIHCGHDMAKVAILKKRQALR